MADIRTRDWAASPSVVASAHDAGLVLFHTTRGRLFSTNRTGARIWDCLERSVPTDSIVAEISRAYQISHRAADDHTTAFLTTLQQEGLIV